MKSFVSTGQSKTNGRLPGWLSRRGLFRAANAVVFRIAQRWLQRDSHYDLAREVLTRWGHPMAMTLPRQSLRVQGTWSGFESFTGRDYRLRQGSRRRLPQAIVPWATVSLPASMPGKTPEEWPVEMMPPMEGASVEAADSQESWPPPAPEPVVSLSLWQPGSSHFSGVLHEPLSGQRLLPRQSPRLTGSFTLRERYPTPNRVAAESIRQDLGTMADKHVLGIRGFRPGIFVQYAVAAKPSDAHRLPRVSPGLGPTGAPLATSVRQTLRRWSIPTQPPERFPPVWSEVRSGASREVGVSPGAFRIARYSAASAPYRLAPLSLGMIPRHLPLREPIDTVTGAAGSLAPLWEQAGAEAGTMTVLGRTAPWAGAEPWSATGIHRPWTLHPAEKLVSQWIRPAGAPLGTSVRQTLRRWSMPAQPPERFPPVWSEARSGASREVSVSPGAIKIARHWAASAPFRLAPISLGMIPRHLPLREPIDTVTGAVGSLDPLWEQAGAEAGAMTVLGKTAPWAGAEPWSASGIHRPWTLHPAKKLVSQWASPVRDLEHEHLSIPISSYRSPVLAFNPVTHQRYATQPASHSVRSQPVLARRQPIVFPSPFARARHDPGSVASSWPPEGEIQPRSAVNRGEILALSGAEAFRPDVSAPASSATIVSPFLPTGILTAANQWRPVAVHLGAVKPYRLPANRQPENRPIWGAEDPLAVASLLTPVTQILRRLSPRQAKTIGAVAVTLPALGSGEPLTPMVRQPMETILGRSLAAVRLHTSPLAEALGDEAFIASEHIVFAPGRLDLRSTAGLALLGHELAHLGQPLAFKRLPGDDTAADDTEERAASQQEEAIRSIIKRGWSNAPRMEVRQAARALAALTESSSRSPSGGVEEPVQGIPDWLASALPSTSPPAQGAAEGQEESRSTPLALGQLRAGTAERPSAAQDVDILARKVYNILRTWLRAERDRHNVYTR